MFRAITFSSGLGCDGASLDFVAGNPSATATEGFTWEMESGTYFAALGAKESGLPSWTVVVVSIRCSSRPFAVECRVVLRWNRGRWCFDYYGRDPSL